MVATVSLVDKTVQANRVSIVIPRQSATVPRWLNASQFKRKNVSKSREKW